jgi:hypothetical protein
VKITNPGNPAGKALIELTDLDKELLGFLHGRIGHRAMATMPLRELQQHFAEVDAGRFWDRCMALVEAELILNRDGDAVSLSPDGWKIAHDLQGKPAIRNPRVVEKTADLTPSLEEHLVWDLSKIADYERASRYAMSFRQSLCVFSPPVQQLYTNYNIVVPKDNQKKLIILPNPQADHDTFNFINADAAVPTRIFITPDADGRLLMQLPMTAGKWHSVPLNVGLTYVQGKLGDAPFLPVLAKGDLREVSPSQPVMHLHRLILANIKGRSDMELRSIRKTIQGKLTEHFGFKPV